MKQAYRALSQHVHTGAKHVVGGVDIKFDKGKFDSWYSLYIEVVRLVTIVLLAYWPEYRTDSCVGGLAAVA